MFSVTQPVSTKLEIGNQSSGFNNSQLEEIKEKNREIEQLKKRVSLLEKQLEETRSIIKQQENRFTTWPR